MLSHRGSKAGFHVQFRTEIFSPFDLLFGPLTCTIPLHRPKFLELNVILSQAFYLSRANARQSSIFPPILIASRPFVCFNKILKNSKKKDLTFMKNETLKILYEDSQIIVCKKPAGIPTQTQKLGTPDMVSLLKNHLAACPSSKGSLSCGHLQTGPACSGPPCFAKTPSRR